MTIDELLQERRIHRQKATSADIHAALARAGDDRASAEHMLGQNPGWVLSIAYNAVLQASRALMFSQGFRPASHESHKNTFAFLRETVSDDRKQLIGYFDRMRIKRHEVVNGAPDRVSRTEAETLIDRARGFLGWVKDEAAN